MGGKSMEQTAAKDATTKFVVIYFAGHFNVGYG